MRIDGTTQHLLQLYSEPAHMTSAGRHRALLEALPRDVAQLARIAHGLVVHEHLAGAYGITLTDEDRASAHIRPVERLLDRVLEVDGSPLVRERPAEQRVAGNCRQFTVLIVTMLRAQGVPARARCGFGGYFGTGSYEDHWVCEYWQPDQLRWTLVDAQIDDVQRGMFDVDFDLMDVPRDRFLVAGDAWARFRDGEADPSLFGLSQAHEAGAWWIAGNLLRDVAAMNNMEMLPWDVWGAMPAPGEAIEPPALQLFDRLAALTRSPDQTFDELVACYQEDDRVRVPATVFNAVLHREEAV